MNPQILFVMRSLDNPDLFTQEEIDRNIEVADNTHCNIEVVDNTYGNIEVADNNYAVDTTVAWYVYSASSAPVGGFYANLWVNDFFKLTGEDKQVYIDEVARLKGE